MGYSGADLTDMEFSMLLSEDSVDAGVEVYEAVVAGEAPEICGLEFLTEDGETVLVEVGSSPVEHEGKSAALLILRDLSSREWPGGVEEELEGVGLRPVAEEPMAAGKLEEMYAAVAQHSSDGIVIVKGSNMQELAFMNGQAVRMIGYTYKQMSKEVEEKGAAFWFGVIDSSDPAVVQALTEQYQRGESFEEGGIPWVELDFRRRDGTVVPAEMGLSGFELEGEPAYVVFIRDVTEKRQAEEARREAESRYRSIFDQSLELVTISDLKGRLLDANDCLLELLGYTREEWTEASYADIIHPDDLEKATESYTETIEKGASEHPVEMRLVSKSGEEVWIDFVGTCLRRGDEPYAVLVIARDITDRIRWEKTLEQSEQRLKEAVAKLKVSHEEISTPVVQMWDHVLALPLIGTIDESRAQRVMEVLLNRIVETQSELVILDVTGVGSIDTHVTDNLLKTIKSCSLLGAQCVVTGINPEMSQTLVSLGLNAKTLVIKKDLQDGLRWSLRKMGYELRNGV
jgi:PAS domain S-box-containing protein